MERITTMNKQKNINFFVSQQIPVCLSIKCKIKNVHNAHPRV